MPAPDNERESSSPSPTKKVPKAMSPKCAHPEVRGTVVGGSTTANFRGFRGSQIMLKVIENRGIQTLRKCSEELHCIVWPLLGLE